MRTLDGDEAAGFLKCDRETIRKLVARGELPCASIGRAHVFLEDDLVIFLRAQIERQTQARRAIAASEDAPCVEGAPQTEAAPRRGRPRKPLPTLPKAIG